MHARAFAQDWLSPGMIRLARRLLAYLRPPSWEYLPEGWPKIGPRARGWDAASTVAVETATWAQFMRLTQGTGPLGLAHETNELTRQDYAAHNTMMAFAYVLALAGRGAERFSFLDWGGGLGHYYLLSKALVPELELDYHCKDLPLICQRGRELLPDAHFHETVESCRGRTYDLVLSSSSLHYSENWREVAAQLAEMTGSYLYITRIPIVRRAASFVVLQRPYRAGYRTEYPGWFLNNDEFLDALHSLGMELVREFLIDERPFVHRAPEQGEYRGFLWRPTRREETTSA
jgi:putative methyltransferase (TIGR04325 family)